MRTVPTGSSRVRRVVVGALWLNVAGATALSLSLVRPEGVGPSVVVGAVLALHTIVHALVLLAAVSPWWTRRRRTVSGGALLAVTAVAAPVLAAWGAPGEEPWAWLLGFSVGALTVLWWPGALGGLGAGVLALAAGGGVGSGTVSDALRFAALSAVLSGGFALLVVWMLGVLVGAEEGREAQARLAVADERLRVARELHYVLGHRLSVLALRAELADDAESQELARRTLADIRAAVHGYGTVDLAEQLRSADLVLSSAGVRVEVVAAPVRPGARRSQLLGAALREAVTNVLQHSEARRCRIVLADQDGGVRLTVDNDGVDPSSPRGTGGIGLAGLAERARLDGASLRAFRDGSSFSLVLDVPAS